MSPVRFCLEEKHVPFISLICRSLTVCVAVLQFVGSSDNPRSCRFSQMMEQRLEKVFSEAQTKMFNGKGKLSVQVMW